METAGKGAEKAGKDGKKRKAKVMSDTESEVRSTSESIRKRFLVLAAKESEREDEGNGKHVSGNGLASLSTEAMVKMMAKGAEEIAQGFDRLGKDMANWAEALKQVTQVIVSPDNDTG
jgi:type II secretory pathway component PulF